jgi:hypothetical protein
MNIIPDSIDFAAYMKQTMHKANVIPAKDFCKKREEDQDLSALVQNTQQL